MSTELSRSTHMGNQSIHEQLPSQNGPGTDQAHDHLINPEEQPVNQAQNGENYTVASLRLPVEVKQDESGNPVAKPTIGGMASAVDKSLGSLQGTERAKWIGWHGNGNGESGGLEEALMTASREKSFDMISLNLTEDEVRNFYKGYTNDVLWPLFHGFTNLVHTENRAYWPTYQNVNQRYAETIANNADPESFIWVQDYHLMLTAKYLKEIKSQHTTGFFLHIPFPPQQTFAYLPPEQREALVDGLLHYDLVGFHTPRDVNHFIDTVRATIPDAEIEYPNETTRRIVRTVTREDGEKVRLVTHAEAHPIGIDAQELNRQANTPQVIQEAQRIRDMYPEQQLLFDASRADYTKGIPDGILALETAIEKYPDIIKNNVTFIQVMAPSRGGIQAYDSLWQEVLDLSNRVNTTHGDKTWKPIDLKTVGLNGEQMKAHLKAADVGYVKTLIDGFNLVAPEYVTASDDGVLILGEKAGAATILRNGALLVDPTDHEQTADAIKRGVTMPQAERIARLTEMKRSVAANNIHRWAKNYTESLRRIRAI